MGFNIARDSLQETLFVVTVLGLTLSIVATILRFVATKRAGRKPSWEDWFAVLATFFFILYVVPLLYLLVTLNGKSARELTLNDLSKLLLAAYAYTPQFCAQQLFAKLSLLFLYYRIFGVNRTFALCLYFVGIFQLLWSVATFFVHLFECTPVHKNWNPEVPGHCINRADFLIGGELPNSLVDFVLVGLAMWMVQSLKMRISTKIKLSGLFLLGGLAGIIGLIKIGQEFRPQSNADLHSKLLDPLWAVVQQTCSVICCCAPIYKPLFSGIELFSKLRSYGSQIFRRTRVTEDPEDSQPIHISAMKSSEQWIQLDEPRAEV